MKILKVLNCGGCGESKFDSEFDSTGWCMRSDRGIRRYELPNWCPWVVPFQDGFPAECPLEDMNAMMKDRDEVINKAIEKLSKLTGEDFHGYRSEIWIVLGAVYDSGDSRTSEGVKMPL